MKNRIFRVQITNHFDKDELITLCFDLEIDHEAFSEKKDRMVQQLITYCQRHGKTDELLAYCQMSRSNIDWSLEQLATSEKGKTETQSATHILDNIVPAGSMQPDGRLMPNAINAVKDFINYWNKYGKLSLLVIVFYVELEESETLFHGEDQTYLFTEHDMFKVWAGTSINNKAMGKVQSPTNINENEYYMALEFFLVQMGLLKKNKLKVEVLQIVNLDNSFIITIQEPE